MDHQPSLPPPAEVIPHRDPFLLLTAVDEVVPGERVRGRWHLSGDEWFWPGHFPGRPTLPGVLMVESLAQLGAYGLLSDPRFAGRLPLFGGIDSARFRRQVVPGETLDLEVVFGKVGGTAGRGSGTASVGGQRACQVEMLFVLAPAERAG